MSLTDHVDGPFVQAQALEYVATDPPDYIAVRSPFNVFVLELPADRKLALGRAMDRDVVQLLCDLLPSLASPVTEQERVDVTGWGRYSVLSVERITAENENLCRILCERFE